MTGVQARVAVIGDVGGHLAVLDTELARLGCEVAQAVVPEGLTIIQVGDLVHRGNESDGVISRVRQFIESNPDQWIQLAGNHEAQYLREPAFKWHQTIAETSAKCIRTWWATGLMTAAAAFTGPRGAEWVVSHAGITAGFWRTQLERPTSAIVARDRINAMAVAEDGHLFTTGCMLRDSPPNMAAGPLWASAAWELIPSWLSSPEPMPFNQVHGHSSIMNWELGVPSPNIDPSTTIFDATSAHELTKIGAEKMIIGIDPGHDKKPFYPWRSLVFENAIPF